MRRLTYISITTKMFQPSDLEALQQKCIRNNRLVGVTGMLVYKNGQFLQVLEGPAGAVEEVFSRIKLDKRHTSIVAVSDRPIETREFEVWDMGFEDLDRSPLPQAEPFTQERFQQSPHQADQLLNCFARAR